MLSRINMGIDEEFPVRNQERQVFTDRFNSMKFSCIRCGLNDLNKSDIEFYIDGNDFPNASPNSIEQTFFVTGMLFCNRCKHRFFVKILDQRK